ncbi:GNAT family N-acetyltransferase [Shewanella sedimentimangrovi]|uniref:GNAT family N-acetyltransferase n=1 Tax=Shewanella sedimentimangrovi TaxID=2814293 RepID=A0ABX7QWD7_9GAMM|nr:GNAT family N-acetyltransferase [Shewanella sedimentimangrovi]QSX35804.1 GNAT family N-acetyltransferase [Shewanella sedimentimangrovi]
MQIRLASAIDLDNLVPLFNAYRQSLGQVSDPLAAREFLGARLRENDSVIFLALDENNAVGFIQLYPSFSSILLKPLWYFDDLYVTPAYREQGIDKRLIQKAQELALEAEVLAVRRTHVSASTSVVLDEHSGDRTVYELMGPA